MRTAESQSNMGAEVTSGGRGRTPEQVQKESKASATRAVASRLLVLGLLIALVGVVLPAASPVSAAAQDAEHSNPWADSERDRWTHDGPTNERASQHIINGTPIAINERPWHVLVSDEDFNGTWCGGSILAANLVLTAAHCVDNATLDLSRLVIVAGSERWRDIDNGQWRFAANVTMHPSYIPGGGFGGSNGLDLALIELDRPLTLGPSVQPITLADPDEAAAVLSQEGDITGWGVATLPARDADTVETLRHGVGEIISDSFCGALIGRALNSALEMCLDGFETGQTGCFGDSGGGTTVEIGGVRKLVGVASFTIDECAFGILVLAETATATEWIDQNSPPITVGASYVNGRVWDDTNFDSVEDPAEGGLAGIEVSLAIPPPPPAQTPALVLTTITDAQGRYSFAAPFGGWYDVTITIDPMVVLSPPTDAGTEATNTDVWGRSRDRFLAEPTIAYTERFLMRPGYTRNDVDFGATMGALVSGVVFDDLDRDGQRDAGEPLSSSVNAYVDVYRTGIDGPVDQAIDSRDLFDDNIFTFAVPPGDSYLSFFDLFTDRVVTLPNRGDDLSDNDFSPFTNETATFSPVVGETYTFDLGLTPTGTGNVFVDVANTDCDGNLSILDALVVAQYSAGVRSDGGSCPMADPTAQLNVANADFNLDGSTDIIDALLVAQCVADLATPYCRSLEP